MFHINVKRNTLPSISDIATPRADPSNQLFQLLDDLSKFTENQTEWNSGCQRLKTFLVENPEVTKQNATMLISMSPENRTPPKRKQSEHEKAISSMFRKLQHSLKSQTECVHDGQLKRAKTLFVEPSEDCESPIVRGNSLNAYKEEVNLRDRIGLINILQQNFAAIQNVLTQRESLIVELTLKFRQKEREFLGAGHSDRHDKYPSKLQALHNEIHRQKKLLETIRPQLLELATTITDQRTSLRKSIVVLRKQKRLPLNPLLVELDGPLHSLKENWIVQANHPKLFELQKASILDSISDYDLQEFLDAHPIFIDILVRHPQAPSLLEALQFDGVSFCFSGLVITATEDINTGMNNKDINMETTIKTNKTDSDDPTFADLLSSWIVENEYFYKLGLDECHFQSRVWKVLSFNLANSGRVTEMSLTRSGINQSILKILLKGIRRNPICILNLGYNPLGADGLKLLFSALTQQLTCITSSPSAPSFTSSMHNSSLLNSTQSTTQSTTNMELNDQHPPIIQSRSANIDEQSSFDVLSVAKSAAGRTILPSCSSADSIDGDRNELTAAGFTSIRNAGGCGESSIQSLGSIRCPPIGLSLTELILPVNELGDKGALIIAKILKSSALPHLHTLDLRWNKIGEEGAGAIAGALTFHACERKASSTTQRQPLNSLNLSGNSLGSAGATSLISALTFAPHWLLVRNLNLSMNQIGNQIFPSLNAWLAACVSSSSFAVLDALCINFEWNSMNDLEGLKTILQPLASINSMDDNIATTPSLILKNNELSMPEAISISKGRLIV